MTHYLSADINPMGDENPPRCYLSGTDASIPVIEFSNYPARFCITLGNHDDPVAYLRRFAAELSDFADVVEQAKAQAGECPMNGWTRTVVPADRLAVRAHGAADEPPRPSHFTVAEHLLAEADQSGPQTARDLIARAQVHALLAVAEPSRAVVMSKRSAS